MIKNQLKRCALALVLPLLGVTTVMAQTDVTSTYIVNPSFEYSAEGVAYTANKALNNGDAFYGWTAPTLNSSMTFVNIDITKDADHSGFGKTTASDGTYFFFNRRGWGDATSSLKQTISSLVAGKYYVSIDYKAAASHDNSDKENAPYKSTLGIKVSSGDDVLVNFSSLVSAAKPGSSYFTDSGWKTMGVWFTVETTGEVMLEFTEFLKGVGQRADICLDNVRLYKWNTDDEVNYANASVDNPMDVTGKFVENPYFDTKISDSPWMSTTGSQNSNQATNQFGAFSSHYFENWNPSPKTCGKMYYSIASGLPEGKYRLTMAAWGNHADGIGLNVFAGSSQTPVTSTTPVFYSVETIVNNGALEIGLELSEGNASNHVGIDNVRLEYLGEVKTPSLGDCTYQYESGSTIQNLTEVQFTYPVAYDAGLGLSLALATEAKATLVKNEGTPIEVSITEVEKGFSVEIGELEYPATYTLTIPAGIYGYIGQSTNEAITVTYNSPIIKDGVYYLSVGDMYVSRGNPHNTHAVVDEYGIAVELSTIKGQSQFKFVDNDLYLFSGGEQSIYTDNSSNRNWLIEKAETGYYLKNANDNGSLNYYVNVNASNQLVSDNANKAVFTFETPVEHDAKRVANETAQVVAVASAAGMTVTSKAELETELAKPIYVTEEVGKYITERKESYQAYNERYTETLTGLNPGLYKVCVNAFHRSGSYDRTIYAKEKGVDNVVAYLYANDEKIQLKSPLDEAGPATAWVEGNDREYKGLYYPNNMDGSEKAFDAGYYLNELYVYVPESGTLKIGLVNNSNVGGSWTMYKNLTVTRIKKVLNLSDEVAPTYEPGIYDEVKFTRALKAGYNTIALPFDVTTLPDGVTAYTVVAEGTSTTEIATTEVTSLEANKPYLLNVESAIVNPTFTNVNVKAIADNSTTAGDWVFHANYTPNYSLVGKYGVSGDKVKLGIAGAYANGMRGWFEYKGKGEANAMIRFDKNDGTTSIEAIESADAIVDVYSVSGQLVKKAVKASEAVAGLNKGLYIIGGEKVYVK